MSKSELICVNNIFLILKYVLNAWYIFPRMMHMRDSLAKCEHFSISNEKWWCYVCTYGCVDTTHMMYFQFSLNSLRACCKNVCVFLFFNHKLKVRSINTMWIGCNWEEPIESTYIEAKRLLQTSVYLIDLIAYRKNAPYTLHNPVYTFIQ